MVAEGTNESTREADVLIVGAGIAGSALACALRDSGLDVLLIDKSAEPLDTARGDHLQPRTCEILDRWGVLEDFIRAGARKRAGAAWYTAEGDEIFRTGVDELDVPHPFFLFLNHEDIARTLLDAALRKPGVDVIRPIRNCWFERGEPDVHRVRIAPVDGEPLVVGARLVVGADGRDSRVRKAFGFEAGSNRYERAIAVMFAEDPERDADNNLRVYLSDEGIVSVIPRAGGGCKIGVPVDMREARQWRGASSGELEARLARLVPALDVREVVFADLYPPVQVQTASWVRDSVVLIGDACHAMHPARSQGMNIAMRCVDALARELCAIAADFAPGRIEASLKRYEAATKPDIDRALADNHEAGLQMDVSDAETLKALAKKLAAIASDDDASRAWALRSAGYA